MLWLRVEVITGFIMWAIVFGERGGGVLYIWPYLMFNFRETVGETTIKNIILDLYKCDKLPPV